MLKRWCFVQGMALCASACSDPAGSDAPPSVQDARVVDAATLPADAFANWSCQSATYSFGPDAALVGPLVGSGVTVLEPSILIGLTAPARTLFITLYQPSPLFDEWGVAAAVGENFGTTGGTSFGGNVFRQSRSASVSRTNGKVMLLMAARYDERNPWLLYEGEVTSPPGIFPTAQGPTEIALPAPYDGARFLQASNWSDIEPGRSRLMVAIETATIPASLVEFERTSNGIAVVNSSSRLMAPDRVAERPQLLNSGCQLLFTGVTPSGRDLYVSTRQADGSFGDAEFLYGTPTVEDEHGGWLADDGAFVLYAAPTTEGPIRVFQRDRM